MPVKANARKNAAFSKSSILTLNTVKGKKRVRGLKTPVLIYLDKLTATPPLAKKDAKRPPFACRYLDVLTGRWVTDGCTLAGETADKIICRCDHLTTFASTVNPDNIDELPDLNSIVTTVGNNTRPPVQRRVVNPIERVQPIPEIRKVHKLRRLKLDDLALRYLPREIEVHPLVVNKIASTFLFIKFFYSMVQSFQFCVNAFLIFFVNMLFLVIRRIRKRIKGASVKGIEMNPHHLYYYINMQSISAIHADDESLIIVISCSDCVEQLPLYEV
jgi:hypothetical protein